MGSGGGIRIVVVVLIILVVLYLFGGLRLPRCGFLLFKAFHRRPVRAKNIGALLVFWIGTMGIAFLAGYVPKHSQLRDDEVQIANLDFKLKLAHLRTLAGTLYLQSSERNYGLAAQTSSQFFDQLPSFVDQVNDPKLNQMLMELSKSQDQITAGLANGDPAVLPKIADLLQKTLSTETL